MTKEQLDNLIGFAWNFHPSTSDGILKSSPNYIREKWDRFIGVKPIEREIFPNYYTSGWLKTWKVSNEDFKDLKEILQFLIEISKYRLLSPDIFPTHKLDEFLSPSQTISIFEREIGVGVEQINKIKYNGNHIIIQNKIQEWIELVPGNKRDYKLNILV